MWYSDMKVGPAGAAGLLSGSVASQALNAGRNSSRKRCSYIEVSSVWEGLPHIGARDILLLDGYFFAHYIVQQSVHLECSASRNVFVLLITYSTRPNDGARLPCYDLWDVSHRAYSCCAPGGPHEVA